MDGLGRSGSDTRCNDAFLRAQPDETGSMATGDPTETALLVAGAKLGLNKPELDTALPRVAEITLDSDRKRMTTVHQIACASHPLATTISAEASLMSVTKGAADGLLPRCTGVVARDGVEPLNDELRDRLLAANNRFGAEGVRVLAVAVRPLQSVRSGWMPTSFSRISSLSDLSQ